MIVVTGATGNTSRPAVEALLSRGQKVRVLGRSAERLAGFAARGAEPFVCDAADSAALTQAFTGADAVYAMIPFNPSAPDLPAYEDSVSDALAAAIRNSGVRHVVVLSSVGAHLPDRTGPILGLRRMEQKINAVPGINVLHLRPASFMENTLSQVPVIQKMGMMGGIQKGDLRVAMIATRDVGAAAADALERRNFSGTSTRELLGQRDLSMDETATIIGTTLGKPKLSYSRIPEIIFKGAMRQFGFSSSVADNLVELTESLNDGYMKPEEPRTAGNTTPTSFETFVAEVFVPAFHRSAAIA
ncbi:MAG: NAD(P)H-binding protein [Candidatus Acidiferrales bacterium]